MLDTTTTMREPADDDMVADGVTTEPVTATSYTCPHCSFVNWCTFDQGHTGQCHCDKGHYRDGNH